MYLKMIDNSAFGDWRLELNLSNEKIVFIDDKILEKLDCNFLYSFKTILRKNDFISIKEYKNKPKGKFTELDFYSWVGNYKKSELAYKYKYDYLKSLEILEEIFEREVA